MYTYIHREREREPLLGQTVIGFLIAIPGTIQCPSKKATSDVLKTRLETSPTTNLAGRPMGLDLGRRADKTAQMVEELAGWDLYMFILDRF